MCVAAVALAHLLGILIGAWIVGARAYREVCQLQDRLDALEGIRKWRAIQQGTKDGRFGGATQMAPTDGDRSATPDQDGP